MSAIVWLRRHWYFACLPALLCLTPLARADRPVADSWLDRTSHWNQPGAVIPLAPQPEGGGNLANCPMSARSAALPEDALVTTAGWTLTGAAQIYGPTTVVMGMANTDGMCRPLQYQVFVFHNGQFAGTLAPQPMNARSDGSLTQHTLYRADYLDATFARYTPEDALCCPSGESRLSYEIKIQDDLPVVMPQ